MTSYPPASALSRFGFLSALVLALSLGFASSAHAYRVDGTVIRTDAGAEFVVKGTNIGGYNWHFYRDPAQDVGLIKDTWKFNTVRICNIVGPNDYAHLVPSWRQNKDYLYNLIKTFRDQGVVVIVNSHDLMGSYSTSVSSPTRAQIKTFLADLANRYKNDKGVWINIRNEPGSMAYNWGQLDPIWLSEAEDLINTVRATGNRNIILVGESAWAQGAANWDDNTVTDYTSGMLRHGVRLATTTYQGFAGNVAFDWHVYDQWINSTNKMGRYIDDARAKNLCLVVGEFGSHNGDTNPTIAATRKLRDIAFPKKVGAIVWSWGDAGDANDLTQYWSDPWDFNGGGWTVKLNSSGAPTNLTELGTIVWNWNRVAQPPASTTLPDLIVTDITAAANNRYNIVVKNQGGVATGSKWIGVQLRRNGAWADWGGKTVNIAAGAITTFTTNDGVAPVSGSWTAWAQVDYTNAVAESNEANNTFSKTLP